MDDDSEPDGDHGSTAEGRETGWYRHSSRPGGHRYWNGREWVDQPSER